MIQDFIPDPDLDFFTHPGSRGQKGTVPRIRNNACFSGRISWHPCARFLLKETKMMDWILQLVKELKSERSAKVIYDGF
jgi:hypothetical protein